MNYLKNELIERINFYKGWIAERKNPTLKSASLRRIFFSGSQNWLISNKKTREFKPPEKRK